MKPVVLGLAVLALFTTAPTAAQDYVPPSPDAARFQTIDYQPNRVFPIAGSLGYAITIVLAPDEQVQSIALGDASLWQATPSGSGNYIFLKPLQNQGAGTNMTVVTDARTYVFELTAGESSASPYVVRFHYPEAEASPPAADAATRSAATYRLSGSRTVRPVSIVDDGVHVYIEWPPELALPVVYARSGQGRETLLNGAVREGRYVIDSINERLVFRRDNEVGYASRVLPKKRGKP